MKAKTRLLLIAMAAILLTVLTQPALAFYTTIGKATNVVTSGNVRLKLHEKTADGSDFPEEGPRRGAKQVYKSPRALGQRSARERFYFTPNVDKRKKEVIKV